MSDCLGTAGDERIGSDIDFVGLEPSISANGRCRLKVQILFARVGTFSRKFIPIFSSSLK